MTTFINNDQLKLAFDFVEYTGRNIFLTGKAGTGKTTFLHQLKQNSPKRMVVVAPTGVAAINAGGVTIHSFFQLPFGPYLPNEIPEETKSNHKFNREKIAIIKSLELLVIDEISMVRADLLDGIDEVLRQFKNRNQPFGGVQLLMIGDLQQLAPVVKDDDWALLKSYYETMFFFSSKALTKTNYISIELTHIFRQQDEIFINLLNKIRDNNADQKTLEELNKRHIPNFTHQESDGYITLTTHNYQAQEINTSKLKNLSAKTKTFSAFTTGIFPEYSYPTDFELNLKTGAQVMFVKNDSSPEKLFYNGKIGRIVDISEDVVYVSCPGETKDIEVKQVEWKNTKYTLNETSKEISESIVGTFSQIPLKLAWAITIHKSQGLTFEKAIIDAKSAFAHGQVYVALSRCKTIEGMVLSTPISNQCIKSDTKVSDFNREIEQNQPGQEILKESKLAFQKELLFELFDFINIFKRLIFCTKLINEHQKSLLPSLIETILQMNNDVKSELLDVSEKFKPQLQQLISNNKNIEENIPLQERIKKACTYFLEKLEPILIDKLKEMDIEIDNKAVRKLVNDAIEKLTEEIKVKHACLKYCTDGFLVKNYMETRAKAAIEPAEKKSKKKTYIISDNDKETHKNLLQTLKVWRKQKAEELNVAVFQIVPQKTFIDLVHQLPTNLADLKNVNGFGTKRIKQFGTEIINIIIEYRNSINLEISSGKEKNEVVEKTKTQKINSKLISFELFNAGKSIEEIAKEREMVVQTIENHLAHYIGTGEISIEKLVPIEKTTLISEWFLQNKEVGLSPAKEHFGDSISFSELRFVKKHIEFLKSKNL